MTSVNLDREDVQKLFDLCVNSLNFGSGFLETDDVECLRKVAGVLGVDPERGTPSAFLAGYRHRPQMYGTDMPIDCRYLPCDVDRCDKPYEDPIHIPLP